MHMCMKKKERTGGIPHTMAPTVTVTHAVMWLEALF